MSLQSVKQGRHCFVQPNAQRNPPSNDTSRRAGDSALTEDGVVQCCSEVDRCRSVWPRLSGGDRLGWELALASSVSEGIRSHKGGSGHEEDLREHQKGMLQLKRSRGESLKRKKGGPAREDLGRKGPRNAKNGKGGPM